MPLQVSEGFKQAILGPKSFVQIFRYGAILVFAGTQPDTANDAAGSSPIARITNNGGAWAAGSILNGLQFTQGGVWINDDPAQSWVLKGLGTGIASWFRLVENTDAGLNASTSLCRIDGGVTTVPTAGALRLSTVAINPGSSVLVDHFFFTIPPVIGA